MRHQGGGGAVSVVASKLSVNGLKMSVATTGVVSNDIDERTTKTRPTNQPTNTRTVKYTDLITMVEKFNVWSHLF